MLAVERESVAQWAGYTEFVSMRPPAEPWSDRYPAWILRLAKRSAAAGRRATALFRERRRQAQK
jgi:hypothetical protein